MSDQRFKLSGYWKWYYKCKKNDVTSADRMMANIGSDAHSVDQYTSSTTKYCAMTTRDISTTEKDFLCDLPL